MSIEEVLRNAVEADASDIFLIAGLPLTYKCNGFLNRVQEKMLLPAEIEELVREVYVISQRETINLDKKVDEE